MPLATGVVAAPLALLIAGLGIAISLRRIRQRLGPHRPGDESFQRLQRVHGNAVEHVPLLLLLLGLWELGGAPKAGVLGVGAALLVARLFHASGLLFRLRHPLHVVGASLTYALEVALGVLLVLQALR